MKTGREYIRERFPHAYALWHADIPGHARLTALSINSAVVILAEYTDGHGWQVYTPVVESGRIDVTLDAIEARTRNLEYDYLAKDRP